MMRYTDQTLSSPLKSSGGYKSVSPTPPVDSHRITSAQDNRISLTPLWEFVVRTKTLPEGLDLDVFFLAIQERLRNPEREVRQHALRVLADFIPVIEAALLDEKMATIVPDIVANLGHIGPAVRKGSIDCLRVYLNHSNNSDNILRDLLYNCIEKSHENKMKTNVVIGLIIAVPFLLQRASRETLLRTTLALLEKMVQMTYQEVSLKSLTRIKDLVGETHFDEYIRHSGTGSTRKDFNLLCEVYRVNGRNINEAMSESSPYRNKTYWSDLNQNIVEEGEWKSDSDVVVRESLGEIIEDKIILETEIKLNSGPAITMQIHEESRQTIGEIGTDSEDDARNRMGIVKVLTDESEEDYEPRRTPRRVRFGGEIVKLRTPDSDSNQPSDQDNDSTITIQDGSGDKPVIEIHYTDSKNHRSKTVSKSHIPVPNSKKDHKTVQSEPSSPVRGEGKPSRKRIMFRSSPNLFKSHVFGDKVQSGGSRIPRRKDIGQNDKRDEHTTTIEIKFMDFRGKGKSKEKQGGREKSKTLPKVKVPPDKAKESGKKESKSKSKTPKEESKRKANREESNLRMPKTDSDAGSSKQESGVQTSKEETTLKASKEEPKPSIVETNSKTAEELKSQTVQQSEVPINTINVDNVPQTITNEEESDPVIFHQPIEIFHNLTRSPERKTSAQLSETFKINDQEVIKKDIPVQESNQHTEVDHFIATSTISTNTTHTANTNSVSTNTESKANEDRQLVTADKVLLNRQIANPRSSRNIRTADQLTKTVINQNGVVQVTNNTYNSFHVCSSTLGDAYKALRNYVDSPIPTNDNGDCLTCSSSGSDNVVFDSSWEDSGIIDSDTISNLNCKDDWRTRLRGLEELHKLLQNQSSLEALESRAASLFYLLFSCEQHTRLQTAAEDVLKILFSNMKIETLRGRLSQIVTSLCKMGSPAGVRLSILLMRRISAEEFVDQLLKGTILGAKSSKIREGALQILMTISRIFPSTEVNVPKTTEAIIPLLHDRKKRVRRASLETIAALAQLGTTGVILDVITRVSSGYPDKEQLMRVVRTRLSRKQLPAVDLNGCVRYSTPSGESEIEWISIGSATTSPQCNPPNNTPPEEPKQESKKPEIRDEPLVTAIVEESQAKNEQKRNYWKNNARHATETNEDTAGYPDETESDWSKDSGEVKEDLKSQNLQIWAVDPWTLSTPVKLSAANGTLRPIYLVQREQLQTNSDPSVSGENSNEKDLNSNNNQRRTALRGRSFSPPKRHTSSGEQPERFIAIAGDHDNSNFRNDLKVGNLRKSSSSDHIRVGVKNFSGSTSSSNSGTSIRNSGWNHKNFKSGIPIPVSSDSRVRFKTKQLEISKGPVSIPAQFYRTKSPSPQDTPERTIVSQRAVLVRQPFSSGSESSEFYTPPAEPHLATPTYSQPLEELVLQSPRQSESFVEVDSPRYHNENFTVIDNTAQDVLDQNQAFTRVESDSSEGTQENKMVIIRETLLQRQETVQTEDEFESEEVFQAPSTLYERDDDDRQEGTFDDDDTLYHRQQQKENMNASVDDFDVYDNPPRNFSNRSLSKSEANLQNTHEISRKSVSSAPALNDVLHHIRYESYEESPINSANALHSATTSLPGSVVEFSPEEEATPPPPPPPPLQAQQSMIEAPTKTRSAQKTPRSVSLSRKNSIRMCKREVPVFPDTLHSFPKPREGFNETMEQLESGDWEMSMKGLQGVVRLTRHHPEIVETNIHTICVALGKQIRNLRSQVARAACLASSELFSNHRRALEMDLEELAVPLLHRTADTNKFLRSDANSALDKMCLNMPPPRVVHVLAAKGGGHQNAIVRCAAARLLCSLTNRLGPEKTFQLPKDTRDKIFFSGANMLLEGNLETRKHAKMMFGNLSGHSHFNRALVEAVPVCTMRHIQKTLQNLL